MYPTYESNNPVRRLGCRIVDDNGFVVSAVDSFFFFFFYFFRFLDEEKSLVAVVLLGSVVLRRICTNSFLVTHATYRVSIEGLLPISNNRHLIRTTEAKLILQKYHQSTIYRKKY